ncbi:MAG TPA: cellulase family glycosylhydrolase [Ramlibacter sp.]|uniref:cellulase family glycosylhydrolase n=1 Tax=Ramlibacter sp. TaxID=1917967 RepID=UPI002D678F9E|nr:cellulase family glycosylhydrolase [Ramlibacter sp.]HZY16939.1 cellulase family glycosylhydrolase [Ramlibacter sp.]
MRRRQLMQLAAACGAAPALAGCLWSESRARTVDGARLLGTNLSGMEWAKPGTRRTESSLPNLHYTVPRRADIEWLASVGFRRNRLPVLWEMLQPMLHDSRASAEVRALVGEPGEFHAQYVQLITDVLDAHAAVGATCILDLHNYGRYRDFVVREDGSMAGLTRGPTPQHRPYTTDPAAVQERIFALAPGATLTQAHFADFWSRAARRWKDHPGLGGWGLMNEPHDMPAPGSTVASDGGGEDLTIWPAFAQAAITAIRRIDTRIPIYVAGNEWSAATSLARRNPGFPLQGENLVYEVHLYLDAASNGHNFDFDTEVRKGFSAGVGRRSIDLDTGARRLQSAIRWAEEHRVRLALTEVGMPVDDPRWEESFHRTVREAIDHGVEVCSWMSGNHWPIRNSAMHHTPGWYQHRTLLPASSGPMLEAAGVAQAVLYDEGGSAAAAGAPVTVTLRARGHLAQPLTVRVASDAGGRFSKAVLTLPAGANGADRYTFTPEPGSVATLRYSAEPAVPVPPPRQVYALGDPVAAASTRLADAAHAILARHGASKWEMAHAFTDYVRGSASQDGQPVRAVADSGFGSSTSNAMEMVNAMNTDRPLPGGLLVPVLRTVRGRKALDLGAENTFGLWCKKTAPAPGVQPRPANRAPYDLQDPHFAIAVVAVPGAWNSGVVFQASRAEDPFTSELALEGSRPQARWIDAGGQQVVLAGNAPLPAGRPVVLTLASRPGEQLLRVDAEVVGRAQARFAPSTLAQLLIGSGFVSHYPRPGFRGLLWGVIAGKGAPSDAELAVLERYLRSLAG